MPRRLSGLLRLQSGRLVGPGGLELRLDIGLLRREPQSLRLLHGLLVGERRAHLRVDVRLPRRDPEPRELHVALLVRDLPALGELHHILRRLLV